MNESEVIVVGLNDRRKNQVMLHNRHSPNFQATLALDLVRSAAIVAVDDGETSAGNSKHRVLTPTEVVARSVEIADLMYKAIEEKGWLLDFPSHAEVEATDTGPSQPPGF